MQYEFLSRVCPWDYDSVTLLVLQTCFQLADSLGESSSPLPCMLWSHQIQLSGITPAQVWMKTQDLVIPSTNFRYLQAYDLWVKAAILLPIPAGWLYLPERYIRWQTDIPLCLVSLEVSGWLLDSKLVHLHMPVSCPEVTYRNPNVFWNREFIIFFSLNISKVFFITFAGSLCQPEARACFRANSSSLKCS